MTEALVDSNLFEESLTLVRDLFYDQTVAHKITSTNIKQNPNKKPEAEPVLVKRCRFSHVLQNGINST
jgi:hypothetical protein